MRFLTILCGMLVAASATAFDRSALDARPVSPVQQCPEGTVLAARPYLGPGGVMQQNVGCYPPKAPPPPPFRYSHGALTYDAPSSTWTSWVDAGSQADARRQAIEACQKDGGIDCKAMLSFSNQCAAVARAIVGSAPLRGKDSVNTGASKVDAEANAAKSCRADWGVAQCRVILSECSLHGRRR